MKAILKPFFALCGLVALSTALSADSRLFPAGGGGAGWGEPGFLYSDYLQTAAASGREVEFQGSFVLDNRRPFLAELGTAFPGRVVDEVKSLPLREWGLGYVFEKRRPAHQRALLERGWRLADWLAEETLMAATESSRGGGLIRTLEFDLQSELGGRRAQVGLNVLGALRESNDEAIAWQFRGFKSSGGLGGNTGLIWRRAVADNRALAGANVFLDYETYADENFWRGSAGAELRSAWADVFGNVYRGFSDDVKKNNRTTYTADGYDVELNVHSPELPWLVGEVAYYNFEGKAGDKDDDGVRFGLRFNPLTDLELGVEYDNGDSDDDGKKKWAARIRYSGEFGGVLKAQYRPSTNSGNFEPRDWFFAPVEREYSQRIRKSTVTASIVPEFTFAAANLGNSLPIELEGAGLALVVSLDGTDVVVTGVVNGQAYTPRTLTVVVDAAAGDYYAFPIASALTGTVTVKHMGSGTLTLNFPRTQSTVAIGSTVAIATQPDDFFRLVNGDADIMIGSGGSGTVFIVENVESTANNLTLITRLSVPIGAAPVPVTLKTNPTQGTPKIQVPTTIGVLVQEVTVASDGVRTTMSQGTLSNPQGRVVLAADPLFRTGTTPPIYYKAKTANGPFVVATLEATGGVGGYQWSKNSGALDVDAVGVVSIPSDETATDNGKELVLDAKLIDGREANNPATEDSSLKGLAETTDDFMLTLTLSYRNIADLEPDFNPAVGNVYGLTGEGQEIVVATITSKGGPDAFTYAKTGGQLNVRPADNEGRMGLVVIPASVLPSTGQGAELVLEAELSQPIPGGSSTRTIAFSVTLQYIGVSRIAPPAFAAADDKAILVNNPTSYQVTALSGDSTAMNIATLAEATGGGGTYTYTKMGGELGFSGRVVSIPASMSPTGQNLVLTVQISDSGTGSDATPDVTVMLTVQYVSVNTINLSFDDRAPTNPNDGLVTVYGLQGNTDGQNNVARVVAGGGFGGVTVGKVSGDLDLSGTASGAQINIPSGVAPAGQELVIVVLANEPLANDPRGITDEVRATATVKYEQVEQLGGAYYPVDSNGNGEVPSGAAVINRIHTVGMAAAVPNQFTVASLSVSGGVGDYQYRQIGGGDLSVDGNGQVLMRAGVNPVAPGPNTPTYVIVVAVNDRGTNDNLTPEITLTLTVSYNTIVPIAADVVDTRNNNAAIKTDGGTVYFSMTGSNVSTPFGRVNPRGGFGGSYDVVASNIDGITYDDSTKMLSMMKCSSGTKRIRLTINDSGTGSELTPNPFILDIALTNECVDAIAAQLRNAANDAGATSPLEIFGVAGKTEATVVAAWMASGGGGDLTWTPSGDLRLVAGNDNKVRQVQIPTGTSPETSPGNALSVTVVVNDENDKGGFLTEPLTVEATVNYIEVLAVQLELTRGVGLGEIAISDVLTVYGVESVAKSQNSPDRSVANIAVSGGASNNYEVKLQISGDGATTADTFEIVFDHRINITKVFPAFDDGGELATVAVVVSDTGTNSEVTPDVTMRATVQILPVLGAVQAGGNIVEQGNSLNVVAPTSPSATEGSFTVYVLEGETYTEAFARVSAAATGDGTRDNATVSGVSRLLVDPPTRHPDSTPAEASGLLFSLDGSVAQIRIAPGATPTPSGADLKLVLTYNDRSAFTSVANLTDWLLKTVSVHYESVEAFEPKVRNAAGSEDLGNKEATVYVAPTNTSNRTAAKIMKVGGAGAANADMRIVSQTSTPGGLQVMPNGDVVVLGTVAKDTTLTVVVVLDDTADGDAAGSVTDHATLTATVAYLESRDVVANLVPLPATDNHFLGDAATDGTRTVYWKASETRAKLPLFRLNAASGSGQYTYSTAAPFGLTGFELSGLGNNDRMLELLASIGDGVKAFATVEIDDTGNADEIALTDPATLMATVEVKLVRAIDTALLVPENVPGGAPVGTTLGGLYVRSAAAAESSSVYIASVVARGGVEEFTYTRQSESSAELLLNDDGQVHLAQNYTPDGNKTLSILIAVNDSGDGSTLTDAAMMTLQFVLAETIEATVFLRGGVYLPGGSGNEVVVSDSAVATVRVKTADYGNEHTLFGVKASGGLGKTPAYSIARATGGNENGLVARVINPDGYPAAVLVKQGASGSPKTFGITAVINESTTDPNNLTPPATISVTVLYTAVEPIAGAFEDMDGNAISGNKHVVVKSDGTAAGANEIVASIEASGGVGNDSGGSYTFSQVGPESGLIVNGEGKIIVKQGTTPETENNELTATVRIVDSGDWDHVSDDFLMTVTVVYSSEVQLQAVINDTRQNAVPAQIPQEGGTVYFLKSGNNANAVFGNVAYSGALDGNQSYDVVVDSGAVGLAYDTSTRNLSMTKCTGDATKSIVLKVNDNPDANSVSKELTVGITLTSGPDQCLDQINAQLRHIGVGGQPAGSEITEPLKLYALAGAKLAEKMAVATAFIEKGAPVYTSEKSGGGLDLEGNRAELLTVFLPKDTVPGSGANGNQVDIAIRINDDVNKGGFLTDEAEVKMTVNYIEVQPHGQFQADKAAGVSGDVADGMLTLRRVAASSTALPILTNLRGAIPSKERVRAVGNFNKIQIVDFGSGPMLQLLANEPPDGNVRVITVKVEDNILTPNPEEHLQTLARPDKLFTLSLHYLGALDAAAYDSENTANAISAPVNRYVEQRDSNVAVAVASLSVSGGASPYTYNLTGELALADNNASLVIPASANPAENAGTPLTARIVIDDNGRNDTAPLTVELTANYILIPGHSDLQLVRDGRTQAEDLDGDTIYPKIVGAKSSGVVEALSGLAFKAGLSGETLKRESSGSAAELLFADDASVVEIAGDTEPDGSTLALVLRASDGESPAQAKARSDRLYTLQVRYMKELTADARDAASGGDVINAVRQIRVTEAEATDAHFVAHISVDGGAGGNVIEVDGDDFEISGTELRIVATVVPGDLATGKLLTATVKVNDNGDAVGGAETGEVEILVTANYITLPPVVGSFVETRGDGTKNVPTSSPVTVFSFYTFPPQNLAPATVVATAKATVTGRDGDTFTYHRVGGADTFSVDENTGAIEIKSRRPANGDVDQHLVTVEFRAAANAVATRQTLTVRHQMIRSIASGVNALSTPFSCYRNVLPQPNPPNRGNQIGTQITVILPPGEEGTQYSPGGCSYFVNLPNRFVGIDPAPPGGNRIARTGQDASGLEVYSAGSDTRVRLVGTPPTFTAEDITLSVVVANTHTGPGGHVVPALLQTVYVVFPGVEKLEAVLEDSSGADAAITKPLTVYVGDTDASAKVVASVKASGGEGTEYSYTGTRTGGDDTALLLVTTADSNEIANRIAVPAGFVAKVSPGTEFRFEVAVNDTGGNAARRGATPERKVILTLQYIKTSGPLQAEAAYTTPDIADAANTTYYGAKGEALGAAVNVANIAPSGGIPNYSFAIEEDSSNPAANSELEISGSGNTRVVRLKSGATPSAATSEARRRVITVRVTDTGDVGNSIPVETVDVVVSVNFVEVETHGDLTVEDAGGNNLGTDFVVVTSGVSAQDVVLAPAASVYPERPTRRQDLGREAGVVSEVSHHGLRFNSNGLVITANTPLEGQTLSVVVQATDGATSQPTAAAQAAARQDQTYTISVRYVPAVAAEVLSTTDAALSNTDVVELTVVAGTQLVGKVSASGGVGGTYSYTPTPAQAGGTNLAVDADGNINIIAGTIPLAGDGLSITVNIAVDDDSASADADRDETSAANVQIRVKYVLLEDLALTAKNLQDANVGATDSVGTFYLRDGATTNSAVLVGSVEASGGIRGYTYAKKGGGGDLTFDTSTQQLRIPSGASAATPDTAAATLLVTVQVTDSQSPAVTKELTVRAVFVKVSPHGDLTIVPQTNITPNSRNEYVVVRPASHTNAVDVANITAPQGDTVSKTGGDSELEFTAPNLRIANNTSPTGQTVTAQITQTDGGDADDLTDEKGARLDRIHQIAVRYIPALAAEARDAAGNAALNAPIVITSKAGLRQIARIAASGGTSDSYSYTIENLHTGGNELMVGGSDGIVSIPAGVQPIVGGLALTVRITANDSGDDNDKTDPASAEVTVMYHLLEAPEIVAQDKDGTAALAAPVNVYQLSGVDLAANVPVAKVVGSKGTSPYTFAIFGTNANGMEVDANTGNIVLKSGESTTATGSAADRVITVRLTDSQNPAETADATITVRFEAVAPHGDLTFIAETGVTRNTDSEYVVVQAGTPSAAVPVLNFASVDSVSRTAGDAPLVFVSGSPNRLEIAANTVPTGQTITAEITQTDGDNNDLERTRPDRTYTVSVRYIPALAAEVRNANGVGALVLTDGTLVIEKESAASLNIASIAVSGGTSDTYTYSIDNKHTDNELEVSNDGIVYIPASVAPLPSTGLELTVEISANDSGDDNTATPAAVASITVRYVMDPGLGGQVQVAADNTPAASPTVIYRLVNDAAPAEGLDTGLKVVGLRGDTNAYTYANAGNTNPDGLAVDANTGVISILSGQTPDSNQSKVRLLTVKISGVRNGNPREALVTVSVQFLGVGRFGSLLSFSPEKDADKNPAGDYVLVRPGAVSQALVVIEEFGISRADTITKFGGASELILDENADSSRLRIAANTVPGGNPPVPGGLTLVANLQANDDDSTPQKRARPNRNGYLVTVVYLAAIDATVEDASNTEIPDLANVDISAPAGETSVYVGDIVASGGTGEYTYTKAASDGGVLEVDGNGQVWIPSGQTPTAGDGTDLHILVNVNDTGDGGNRDNSGFTDAKQIRIDVDYILEPGLGGVVQKVSDSTEVTSPTVIYRLANDAAPAGGLPTGLKVVGIRGEGAYTYAIDGTNNSKLEINANNGEVRIAANAQPDGDEHVITVKITDSSTPAKEAMVTLTANFRAVYPIVAHQFNFSSQAACHDGNRRTLGPNARLVMPVREEGFKFTGQTAPGSFGSCQFLGHFDDTRAANPASFAPTEFGIRGGSGNIVRTTKETVGNLEPIYLTDDTRVDVTFAGHTYTDGETEAKIVIAYNDQGPAKDLTPEFLKTLVVVFPGIPRVDAVLNDEGGSPINLTGIEKRGPGGEKVIIGTIVASGGTGSGYTYTKAATGGGALALDSNTGEVSIPDDVAPEAGAGAALHLLVDVDDGGTNSDRTTAKQLRIEVQYIEEQGAPPLAGEVQNADGNEVTAAPTVYRVTNVPTPDLGLPTGLKVVGSGGTAPYSYAAKTPQPPNNKRLLVSADGQVISIPSGQTATPSGGDTERLMTVVITDGAGDTVEVAVTVNFETVSGHGGLTRDLATDAAAGTGTNANTYYIARDGAQSGAVNVLSNVKSSEATNIEVAGIDSGLTFNYDSTANAGVVQIDAGTVPSGQTFAATVRATDGDSTPQAAGRLDRTFQFSVVYLEHLEAQLWDAPSGGATIDIATAIEKTSAAGASVFVGSVSVSGGTGAYEFTKGTSCTNLDVDADGNVFIPTSAAAPVASPGTPGSCQVIINDSGDGSAATPAHGAFNVQVNHILGVVVSLPAADSGDINLTPLSSIENRVYVAQTGTQPVVLPSRLDHSQRFTVFTRNSESAAVAVYSVQYLPSGGVVGGVTEGAGSDFSVGQAAGGAKWHPVMLKAGNLKRWGQLLEARFVTSDNTGYTVTVLLSEQLEASALELGPIGLAGQTDQNRPMQFNLPDDVEADTDYPTAPAFQALVDFPGITVEGLVVNNQKGIPSRGVRATTSSTPIVSLPISEYGNYFWNEDTKTLWRRGEVVRGGNPRYYVELWDTGANPKIIPAVVNFRGTTRKLARMSWAANPGTISPSGNTSFEVQGGAQARNYSPFRDMQVTVNAPFVISNMRRTTPARNDNRFHFDVSLPAGTPAGSYTANITVTDRGYASFGTLTHTATATK